MQRSEEGMGSPGAGLSGGCELPDVGVSPRATSALNCWAIHLSSPISTLFLDDPKAHRLAGQ